MFFIIGGNCHKHNFCHDKSFVMTNRCLSWQNTSFVMTKVCLSWQNFCWDKIMFVTTTKLSWQIYKHICCNKCFVARSKLLLRQKTCFATTNTCLSWQKYVCRDRSFVVTKLCLLWQIFVMTNVLSWETFCHDKHIFVMTKDVFCPVCRSSETETLTSVSRMAMSAVSSLPCYVLASPAFWLTSDPTLWPWSMPSIFLMQFWTVCLGGGMARSTRRCTTLRWTAAWMRNRWVKWWKRAFCTGTWDIGPPGPVCYWTAAWTRKRWAKWQKRALCTGTWDVGLPGTVRFCMGLLNEWETGEWSGESELSV